MRKKVIFGRDEVEEASRVFNSMQVSYRIGVDKYSYNLGYKYGKGFRMKLEKSRGIVNRILVSLYFRIERILNRRIK